MTANSMVTAHQGPRWSYGDRQQLFDLCARCAMGLQDHIERLE